MRQSHACSLRGLRAALSNVQLCIQTSQRQALKGRLEIMCILTKCWLLTNVVKYWRFKRCWNPSWCVFTNSNISETDNLFMGRRICNRRHSLIFTPCIYGCPVTGFHLDITLCIERPKKEIICPLLWITDYRFQAKCENCPANLLGHIAWVPRYVWVKLWARVSHLQALHRTWLGRGRCACCHRLRSSRRGWTWGTALSHLSLFVMDPTAPNRNIRDSNLQ